MKIWLYINHKYSILLLCKYYIYYTMYNKKMIWLLFCLYFHHIVSLCCRVAVTLQRQNIEVGGLTEDALQWRRHNFLFNN